MDPALHEIYSKETSSHLSEIRDYLRKRSGQPAPHVISETVFRAIHTLSGSSKMAEARHGIRITEPLNHVMRKAFDSGVGLSDEGLSTLADAVSRAVRQSDCDWICSCSALASELSTLSISRMLPTPRL